MLHIPASEVILDKFYGRTAGQRVGDSMVNGQHSILKCRVILEIFNYEVWKLSADLFASNSAAVRNM